MSPAREKIVQTGLMQVHLPEVKQKLALEVSHEFANGVWVSRVEKSNRRSESAKLFSNTLVSASSRLHGGEKPQSR